MCEEQLEEGTEINLDELITDPFEESNDDPSFENLCNTLINPVEQQATMIDRRGLELTFEVKDKYKAVTQKIIEFINSQHLFGEECAKIKNILFKSIDINSGKINWNCFKSEINMMHMDDSKAKKIRKKVKKKFDKDFIELKEYEKYCEWEFYDHENVGTEDFNKITERNQAYTVQYIADTLSIGPELYILSLYNRGSKTFVRACISFYSCKPCIEYLAGAVIGTMGQVNKYLNIQFISVTGIDFQDTFLNSLYEYHYPCEFSISDQNDLITISNVSKSFSDRDNFEKMQKDIISHGLEDLNIAILDYDVQLQVKLNISLTDDTREMIEKLHDFEMILLDAGVIDARKVYEEKFKKLPYDKSPEQYYLYEKVSYLDELVFLEEHEIKNIVQEIEKCYAKDSIVYKYVKSIIHEQGEDVFFVGDYIDMFVSRLCEVTVDKIEENNWIFESRISNLAEKMLQKFLDHIATNGNTIENCEITRI